MKNPVKICAGKNSFLVINEDFICDNNVEVASPS